MADLAPAPSRTPDERIVDAVLRCIQRWGVAKTTLDDVAREAGCSRATVYRLFPGGKDGLLEATAHAELARFYGGVAARVAQADSLEDALTAGMAEAGRRLCTHQALQYLLAYEPESVLPRLAFAEMDQVLRAASEFAGPLLQRWLDAEEAKRAAEWVARLVCSYSMTPGDGVDFADEESVRVLVRSFVLPGLSSHH